MNTKGRAERELVMERDRMCFIYRLDKTHVCRDRFGGEHNPFATSRLTVDHFWLTHGGAKGKKAPDDRYHLVAMCGRENDRPPSSDTRQAERDYIHDRYPDYREESKAA